VTVPFPPPSADEGGDPAGSFRCGPGPPGRWGPPRPHRPPRGAAGGRRRRRGTHNPRGPAPGGPAGPPEPAPSVPLGRGGGIRNLLRANVRRTLCLLPLGCCFRSRNSQKWYPMPKFTCGVSLRGANKVHASWTHILFPGRRLHGMRMHHTSRLERRVGGEVGTAGPEGEQWPPVGLFP